MKRIRATLCGKAPFITSLLCRARIVESKAVPTAGIDKRTVIYINPDFWDKLDFPKRTWVISHELFHGSLLHPLREGSRVPNPEKDPSRHLVWNIAADAVANTVLAELIRNPEMERFAVTADRITSMTGTDPEEVRKMSVEEIFDLLMERAVVVEVEVDIAPGLSSEEENGECVVRGANGEEKGKVIQGGDPALTKGSPSEIREAWKNHVSRAYMAQKTAGTMPAGLERIVDEFIRPSIDPRSLIRRAIRYGLGRLVLSDWRRPSRRYPDTLPWVRRLRVPNIWAMIDSSASIDNDELSLFLGTVYEFAKQTEIKVVSWDTEAYEFVTARKPAEVISKVKKHIRGGGGTMIRKALGQTAQRMKKEDIVLVLTDMEIYDLAEPPVQQLLAAVAAKASACAFCTTHKETPVEGWRVIKLQPRAG
jgi:predicted metal-dependent peptidase